MLSSILKTANIISITNAWLERGGSVIKEIKTNIVL